MTRILVAIPTYAGHMFCREKLFSYLQSLTTKNLSFVFITNSGGEDEKDLQERAKKLSDVTILSAETAQEPLDQVVISRNVARDFFLEGDWDYLFFLDSDVFGAPNVIDILLKHTYPITTGWYVGVFEENGEGVVKPLLYVRDKNTMRQLSFEEIPTRRAFIGAAGLGCCLIHRPILENISFRRTTGTEDAAFFWDTYKKYNISLLLDPRAMFFHMKYPEGDARNKFLDPRQYLRAK